MHDCRSRFSLSGSVLTVLALVFLVTGCAGTPKPVSPISISAPPSSDDWAMYGRDAQRTGYDNDEFDNINTADASRLEEAWQDNIGINGATVPAFSAPTVAGGTVYVASSITSGNNFFALDAATGTPRWAANIGVNPSECFGVGIGSTPAVSEDHDVVVIGGGDGAYYGLSTINGEQLWREPLNEGPSAFAWTSPLIVNGKAYIGIASDCDDPSVRGDVYAVDLATGNQIANQYIVPENRAGGGIWNSATISADGTKLFVTTGEDYEGYDGPNTRAILELDASSLQILASNRQGVPNTDGDWATTPVVFEDRQGRPMVGAGHKDGVFYAYYQDNMDAGPVWSSKPGPSVGMLPAYDPNGGEGGVIFINGQHKVYALNASDGTAVWTSDAMDDTTGNMAVANGLIYVNVGGSLLILDEATGKTLRTITPDNHGPGMSGPVVYDGVVYWVSGAFINAWHLPDGAASVAPTLPYPLRPTQAWVSRSEGPLLQIHTGCSTRFI